MRTIPDPLYRARSIHTHNWVYGFLSKYFVNPDLVSAVSNIIYPRSGHCILSMEHDSDRFLQPVAIDSYTICMNTGLKDIFGRDIFQNDIVKCKYGGLLRVEYKIDNSSVGFDLIPYRDLLDSELPDPWCPWALLEVVGNIYDGVINNDR